MTRTDTEQIVVAATGRLEKLIPPAQLECSRRARPLASNDCNG